MDFQTGATRRAPRLSYRARSDDADSVKTASTEGLLATTSTAAASPLVSNFDLSLRLPDGLTDTSESSRSHSIAPSSSAPRTPSNPTKKRSSFFTGMFGVKEPSAQALIDYQKQLLKQGNGRISAVGLPGVSSAKLPPTVPKTNSKWDGVPQTVKEREKQQEMVNRQLFGALGRPSSTARSSDLDVRSTSAPASRKRHSRGTLGGSSAYSSSSNRLVDLYGWEQPGSSDSSMVKEKDFVHERPSTAQTATSWSAPTLQPNSKFPPHDAHYPPEIVRTVDEQPSPVMSCALSVPGLSHSPAQTPGEPSPVTPNAPSPLVGITAPDSDKTLYEAYETAPAEASLPADEVVLMSAGANVLGPPAAGRRPKPTPKQSNGESEQIQELAVQLNSILKRDPAPMKSTSPRPALGSYFTSPSSGGAGAPVRRNSTRDRLGLGMTLKNQADAPPWTTRNGAEDGRNITPTPQAGHSLRRKARMSIFKR